MAINSIHIYNNTPLKSACSSNSAKSRYLNQHSAVGANHGICYSTIKKCNKVKNNIDSSSLYLKKDKVQMVSEIPDKRLIHKKATEFSSFPLAVKLYKANSEEFKLIKNTKKKRRESIITVPNETTSINKEACTVSDMNDSEYYNKEREGRKTKIKKRLPNLNRQKSSKPDAFKYYDRDAGYCAQFNMDLDRSSTDMLRRLDGDYHERKVSNAHGEDFHVHNVWTVLKNINRFQFTPSSPVSESSIVTPKKKRGTKRGNNQKEAR